MRCEQETCGRVMNINEVGHSLEYNRKKRYKEKLAIIDGLDPYETVRS